MKRLFELREKGFSKETAILIGIVLLGSILRIYTLGQKSFWYDEIAVILQAKRPFTWFFVNVVRGSSLHPSIGSLVHFLSVRIYDNEFAARLPAAIAGIISIFLIYKLGKLLFSKKIGLLSAYLLALSPLAIRYSQENRFYMLYAVLFLFATYYFFKSLKEDNWKNWLKYIIFTTLSMLIHTFSFVVLASQYGVFAVIWILNSTGLKKSLFFNKVEKKTLLRFCISFTCILLIAFAWYYQPVIKRLMGPGSIIGKSQFLEPTVAFSDTGILPPHVSAGLKLFMPDLTSSIKLSSAAPESFFNDVLFRVFKWFSIPLFTVSMICTAAPPGYDGAFLLIMILFFCGLGFFKEDRKEKAIIVFLLFLLPLVLLFFVLRVLEDAFSYFCVRRVLFLLPLFLIIVSKGAVDVNTAISSYILKGKYFKLVFSILMVITVVLFGILDGRLLANYYYVFQKDNWRAAAKYLKDNAKRNDIIFVAENPAAVGLSRTQCLTYYGDKYGLKNEIIKGPQLIIDKTRDKSISVWWVSYEGIPPTQTDLEDFKIAREKNFGSHYVWVYKLIPEKHQQSEIDRSKIEIDVLNGNGIKGSGKQAADFLVIKGYKIGKTEDAKRYNYSQTMVQYKPGQEELAQQLADELKEIYRVALKEDESISADIVVIVGNR